MHSTSPTAQTTGAIESIFWLEVHQADINGATTAISADFGYSELIFKKKIQQLLW